MKRLALFSILTVLFIRCGTENNPDENEVIGNSISVQGEMIDSVTMIGNCGIPLVIPIDTFTEKLIVHQNSLGYARVRTTPYCFEQGCNNVLAHIKCGSIIMGCCPWKYRDKNRVVSEYGLIYAVEFIDSNGEKCQGYMSYGVVDKIEPFVPKSTQLGTDTTLDNSNDETVSSIELRQLPTEPEIGCYYELEDDYSNSSNNDEEIEKWWNNKLESVEKLGLQDNILATGGGGPNGAEWNSYADLYFVALFPGSLNLYDDPDDEYGNYNPVTVTINEKPILYKYIRNQSYEDGIMVDFMLEKEVWTYALRAIEPEDYVPLFGKEQVERANKGWPVFVAPMNTGKIFKITIEIQLDNDEKMIAVDYFHISYGE